MVIDFWTGFAFGISVTLTAYFVPSPFKVRGVTLPRPSLPRRRVELPFGMPTAVGAGRSPISGDDHEPNAAEIAAMERDFGLASPLADAAALSQMARERGLYRPPEGDPVGTYRPGETETPPWMRAPQ